MGCSGWGNQGPESPLRSSSWRLCLEVLKSCFCPQVTWCPGRCTTCSPSIRSTMAMEHPCTTNRGRSTGSQRPCTHSATSCTAHKWNGKIPTWNPPRSTSRWKGMICLLSGGHRTALVSPQPWNGLALSSKMKRGWGAENCCLYPIAYWRGT